MVAPAHPWHGARMTLPAPDTTLTERLVSSFYVEAMLLSDEARSYFDGYGRADRALLDPVERVYLSCESLKVTTRLMHILAWLIVHRARLRGEEPDAVPMRLGQADPSDIACLTGLPSAARTIIMASIDLYRRVQMIDADMNTPQARAPSPARLMQQSLAQRF